MKNLLLVLAVVLFPVSAVALDCWDGACCCRRDNLCFAQCGAYCSNTNPAKTEVLKAALAQCVAQQSNKK